MTRRIRAFILSSTIALWVCSANAPLASPKSEPNLYQVTRIFLAEGTQANGDLSDIGMAHFANLRPALKKALLGYHFAVVDSVAEADGVMYGGNTTNGLVLDGPPLDPPKYGFDFWLSSPKHSFKWHTQFDINSRSNESKVSEQAVEKAAKTLFNDWKKSAENAGIAVQDKLP
jgi:hypothetical protein